MEGEEHNILIEQGATLNYQLQLLDAVSASYFDLTGYTSKLEARVEVDDVTPVLALSTGGGGITITPSTGTLTLNVAGSITQAIEVSRIKSQKSMLVGIASDGSYKYRSGYPVPYTWEVTDSGGDVSRVLFGNLVVSPSRIK